MLSRLRLPLPTAAWARALFAPVLMFVANGIDRNYQTDFWHHLARGRAMAESGAIVNRDLFTYTVPGQPFQDTNWLTQLLYHYLFSAGGLPLVQLVNALVMTAMMAVVVWHAWRASRSLTLAAGLGAFTFLGLWQLLLIRPQSFSMLLFAVLYAVLELSERRRLLLAVPPLLMAAWVNLHGGFPIGLMMIGCCLLAAAGEACRQQGRGFWRDGRVRALALCLAASVAATLLNPYGWRVYQYVGLTSTVASARRIDEWVPPGLHLMVSKVWVLSVLGMVVLFALPGRRPRPRELCLVLCFLPLACGSVRMVAWWLLVCGPIAAAQLAGVIPRRYLEEPDAHRPTMGTGLIFIAFVAVSVLSLPWLERYNPAVTWLKRQRTEVDLEGVAARLRERVPGGRIFSRFEWGEYLGWRLAPDYQIFMDGRIEIYPDRVWHEYNAVTRGRADWEQVLDGYGVDCLLLDTHGGYHADLLPLVEKSATWERAFASGRVVVFLRRPAGPATAQR
jgi:hypothetical protein